MKTLVKLAAIAACFVGLNASKASAEFPRGDRNDIWILDTGVGYTEVEWTYLMLLDMGLTEYEAMVLLADKVERPTFGPHIISFFSGSANDGSVNVGGSMDAEPKPTKIERPVFGPHFISCFSGSANDGSANVGGTSGPGGTSFLTANVGGTAGPGGTTFLTANVAGCVPNTD